MLQLTIGLDSKSAPVYALPITDAGWFVQTVVATPVSVSVPAEARFAMIAADDHYFVSLSAIPAFPAGGVFQAIDMEQDKQVVYFDGTAGAGVSLHFLTRNTTDISVSFYR